MKHYLDNRQLSLFSDIEVNGKSNESDNNALSNSALKLVSFRDLVPHIEDTGYLTHSIYYYPAKFIPHVVRYCIQSFTKEKDWILDPFAGSGTVGLEAYLCKRNCLLLDLNPLLNHIMPVKIPKEKEELSEMTMGKMLREMQKSQSIFMPDWSNVEYWYPNEMLDVLSKYWGWLKEANGNTYSMIIESSLIKISKHFSYAEHRTPKLFRSKKKIRYIEKLLESNWIEKLDEMLFKLAYETLKNVNQFIVITQGYSNNIMFQGYVDTSSYEFDPGIAFDVIVTSPPYLQAQEYIRTAKMDLYWLGYNDDDIKTLSKLEIPYKESETKVNTKTLDKVKIQLKRKDLLKLLDSYFCHTIKALENSMNRLKKGARACIFIGNPRIDGIKVEIWRILMEYFVNKGYLCEEVYEDRIKTRQLFGSRKNKNPEGMKSEYLLVLKK
jgi:hypothetical protein